MYHFFEEVQLPLLPRYILFRICTPLTGEVSVDHGFLEICRQLLKIAFTKSFDSRQGVKNRFYSIDNQLYYGPHTIVSGKNLRSCNSLLSSSPKPRLLYIFRSTFHFVRKVLVANHDARTVK